MCYGSLLCCLRNDRKILSEEIQSENNISSTVEIKEKRKGLDANVLFE